MKYAGYGLTVVGLAVGLYMAISGYMGPAGWLSQQRLLIGALVAFVSLIILVITRVIVGQRG